MLPHNFLVIYFWTSSTSGLSMTYFFIWIGPKAKLLEFLSFLHSKNDRIKLTYVIDESSISFLDLFLYKDANFSTLQFSTYQKPLNKYLYIILASNKRAFIRLRGQLMRYTRNSSTFKAFSETRDKFWKHFRRRGYQDGILLLLFREVKYSNRTKWLSRKRKSCNGKMVVFQSTFNCSHANKQVMQRYLPDLDCIVIYKST